MCDYLLIRPLFRTIHGLVYNAMKLFMEINPTLFDECSAEYAAQQESAQARAEERNNKWKLLEELANKHRQDKREKFPLEGSPMIISNDDDMKPANGNHNARQWETTVSPQLQLFCV